MNIEAAIQLSAGGPGSGRHKEGNSLKPLPAPNKQQDKKSHEIFNKTIKQHGFTSTGGVFVKNSEGKNHVIVPLYTDHGLKMYTTQFRHYSTKGKVSSYDSERNFKKEGEPSELHNYLTKKGL